MLSIGKINTLTVTEVSPVGYVLESLAKDSNSATNTATNAETNHSANNPWTINKVVDTQALLPASLSDEHAYKEGDSLEAFLYYGPNKEVLASLSPASISMGELKALPVLAITDAGAFVDWGLPRDLFVPKQHLHSEVAEGLPAVLTLVHEPKQQRLYGSTKIEKLLKDAPKKWDYNKEVDLLVYAKTPLGFKVVIEGEYAGLLYHNELFKSLQIGELHKGFVRKLRDDGKIDCSLQRNDAKQRQSLSEQIVEDLKAHGGLSTLTDKSSPDEIQTRFNVSKGAYKKALGQLYKDKKIEISKSSIKLI